MKVGELPTERVSFGDDVGKRRAVLPLQPFEKREPFFDLLEPRRRGFDAVGIAPQEQSEILELRLDAVACLEIRLEPRVERRQIGDLPPHGSEPGENGLVALVQRRVALRAEAFDPLGAREHLAKRRQFLVLGRLRRRFVQLGELERHQIEPRIPIVLNRAHAGQFVFGRAPRVERHGRGRRQRIKTTERVDHAKVRGRIEERLMLVLAVELDQPRGQVLQRARRGERTVDERPAAPLRGNLAADEQLFPARFEDRFDGCGLLTSADEVARGTAPQEQADGFDEDRFACACLAGQHVEAGIELHLDRVDDGEMADPQEAKHWRKRENSNPNIGLTGICTA